MEDSFVEHKAEMVTAEASEINVSEFVARLIPHDNLNSTYGYAEIITCSSKNKDARDVSMHASIHVFMSLRFVLFRCSWFVLVSESDASCLSSLSLGKVGESKLGQE